MYFHLTIVIIFFILIYVYQKNNTYYTYQNILNKTETKRMNKMIQVIIERGLISPSCHWWKISDSLKDKSGILIYNTMMSRSTKPFIGIEVLQTKVFLVTQPYYINEILQNSPHLFAVGKLKETFFRTFMSKNVGVSTGCPWKRRRRVNEQVLFTDTLHVYGGFFDQYIYVTLSENPLPKTFSEFKKMAEKLTMRIVFNSEDSGEDVFRYLSFSNSFDPFTKKKLYNKKYRNAYFNYLKKNVKDPKKYSLIDIAVKCEKNMEEIIHQIPHWIFPIASVFHTTCTRLLLLLANHPKIYEKVILEINQFYIKGDWKSLYKLKYLRACVLETLRINNNVVSLFRTLTKDYCFHNTYCFKKGTQFAILTNPVLRSTQFYKNAHEFIPERWNPHLEFEYIPSISFSRGPQKCPGKDLTLFLATSFIVHYLEKCTIIFDNIHIGTDKISNKRLISNSINTNHIEHAINPCTIHINVVDI